MLLVVVRLLWLMSLFVCQFIVIFWKYLLIVLAKNENVILMYVCLDVFLCDPCPLFYKFICSFISFISSVPRDPVYGNFCPTSFRVLWHLFNTSFFVTLCLHWFDCWLCRILCLRLVRFLFFIISSAFQIAITFAWEISLYSIRGTEISSMESTLKVIPYLVCSLLSSDPHVKINVFSVQAFTS